MQEPTGRPRAIGEVTRWRQVLDTTEALDVALRSVRGEIDLHRRQLDDLVAEVDRQLKALRKASESRDEPETGA